MKHIDNIDPFDFCEFTKPKMENGLASFLPVKRLAILFCVFIFFGLQISFAQSYCTPSFTFGAATFGNDFWITQTSFGSLAYTGGTANGAAPYYLLSGSTGAVMQGQVYTLTVTRNGNSYNCNVNAYADWNDDGDFDDADETLTTNNVLPASGSNTVTVSSITVPFASVSNIRLRIMIKYNATITDACTPGGSAQGETKDFEITVNAGSVCSGPPNIASVSPSSSLQCPSSSTELSLTGLAPASGYTYQWKYAATPGGPYSDASGTSTNSTYDTPTTLPSDPTYYICEVTCSGNTTASDEGSVGVSSFLDCYCIPSFAAAAGTTRGMVNVSLNGSPPINNNSTGNSVAPYYTFYTGASPEANAGLSLSTGYVLSVKAGTQTGTKHRAGAWIDYNQNGIFETSEFLGAFAAAVAASATGTIAFTVPGSATTGVTVMRVIKRFGNTNTIASNLYSSPTQRHAGRYNPLV